MSKQPISGLRRVEHGPLFTTIRHYSSLFATIRHYSQLFATIRHYSPLFATTIPNYMPLYGSPMK